MLRLAGVKEDYPGACPETRSWVWRPCWSSQRGRRTPRPVCFIAPTCLRRATLPVSHFASASTSNDLITEPGTVEIDWGTLYSYTTEALTLPSALKYTPSGGSLFWGGPSTASRSTPFRAR